MRTENIGHLPKKLVGKFGCVDIIVSSWYCIPNNAFSLVVWHYEL